MFGRVLVAGWMLFVATAIFLLVFPTAAEGAVNLRWLFVFVFLLGGATEGYVLRRVYQEGMRQARRR